MFGYVAFARNGFLSTPSARRATGGVGVTAMSQRFLSTPSARRATRRQRFPDPVAEISIHALREEGDSRRTSSRSAFGYFYPRPPRGGRPPTVSLDHRLEAISIHALREEGDRRTPFCSQTREHFYPRPPRGGRRATAKAVDRAKAFLSTPSARRATIGVVRCSPAYIISIHALREEGDPHGTRKARAETEFLSTPSARRATRAADTARRRSRFLSTPSARRATKMGIKIQQDAQISIHALREEGDVPASSSLIA